MSDKLTNVVVAGLGGQGVLSASNILAGAAFKAGYDVKKSELHGLSQRGGSVASDVRFGKDVDSPMVPDGEADFLIVLADNQVDPNKHVLKSGGGLVVSDMIDVKILPHKRSVNVALLGILSKSLEIPEEAWVEAIMSNFPKKLHKANIAAFEIGRKTELAGD